MSPALAPDADAVETKGTTPFGCVSVLAATTLPRAGLSRSER